MSFEELINLIESVLEMDEQGDRSIALDSIREAVTSMNENINSLSGEINRLTDENSKLRERNAELFLRVEGRPSQDVEKNETETLNDVLKDESIFN